MTETEWTASSNPEAMLTFIREQVSPRQMRLFGCACCRIFWSKLKDTACRSAVVMAEGYADGLAVFENLQILRAEIRESPQVSPPRLVNAAHAVTREAAWAGALQASHEVVQHVRLPRGSRQPYSSAKGDVYRQQADLVRDIFDNCFRPVAIDPAWLAWNDGTVVKLAKTIYDDRRWDIMPILGDALEDAACHDAAILDHCRGPGPHVRGCWVVDLMLGKS